MATCWLLLSTTAMPKQTMSGLFLCILCFLLHRLNAYYIWTCVRRELVKSPEVTLCGWRGYKTSINNINNNSKSPMLDLTSGTTFPFFSVMLQHPQLAVSYVGPVIWRNLHIFLRHAPTLPSELYNVKQSMYLPGTIAHSWHRKSFISSKRFVFFPVSS